MSVRTTLLIIILILTTLFLFYLALKNKQSFSTNKNVPSSLQPAPVTTVPVQKETAQRAQLSFLPTLVRFSNDTTTESAQVDIVLDAQNHLVSGVQLELSFDPLAISNIAITSPSDTQFFGNKDEYLTLLKEIDYKNGRISYALGIAPGQMAKKGIGKLATLSVTPNRAFKNPSSEISFIEKTMVTEFGRYGSVLDKTTPLTIQFGPKFQTSLDSTIPSP